MKPTCSFAAPLSDKQMTIWSLTSKGITIVDIAKKLRTSRQYINQTKLAAEAKISQALLDVAQVNELQVTKVNVHEAILLGYHPGLKRKAVVTYTTKHGMKVWYWHDKPEEEALNEDFLRQTQQYLLDVAAERGIEVKDAQKMHPAKLAQAIFSELIPELRT
jgi:transcriptional regulator